MDLLRVYISSGRPTLDEKRMIQSISDAVNKLKQTDPAEFTNFRAATNKLELREWYKKYCIEDAQIISETKTQTVSTEKEPITETTHSGSADKNVTDAFNGANDPFNAAETIQRDYAQSTNTSYEHEEEIIIEEPQGLPSDFTIPKDNNEDDKNAGGKTNQPQQERTKPEPINPELKDLDDGQKRRAFKQTAASLVLAYKQFSGVPFKYIATRDISSEKMSEYGITGVLDTNIILALPNDVHLSVAQYFEQQCMTADGLFELDPDVEKEILEALTDVLMEKQFALTPTQRLMVAVGQDLVAKTIQLFKFRAQVKETLDYLKNTHAAQSEDLRKREEVIKEAESRMAMAAKEKESVNVVNNTPVEYTAVEVEEVK